MSLGDMIRQGWAGGQGAPWRADARPMNGRADGGGGDADAAADLDLEYVNLKEFAEVEGKSLPTVRKVIDRNSDFPVERRGAKGTDYRIHLERGHEWMRNHEAEIEAAQQGRAAGLHQKRLDLWGDDGLGDSDPNDPDRILTPSEQSIELDNRFKAIKLGKEHQTLANKAEVQRAWAAAMGRIRDSVMGLSISLGRELSLDREQRAKLEADLAAMLNRLGDSLERAETYGVETEPADEEAA